jgi:tetratricopeptide (TPR) repeat protein
MTPVKSTHYLRIALLLVVAAALTACGSAQSRKTGYVERGKQYLASGNYDKARVEFRNAGQIDPKDAEVNFLLGEAAEKLNNPREAVAQYSASIAGNPSQTAARAALGRLYLYAGMPDKAQEVIEPGLKLEPNNAQLLTVRGGVSAQKGDIKAALADAQHAVQLAPSDDFAIALLASMYRSNSQIDKAIDAIQSGLRLLSNNLGLRAILADLYSASGQTGAAEDQLKQIIKLDPKTLAQREALTRYYLQQKNMDAAESTLRETVKDLPDNIQAKVNLIEFTDQQRGRDKAIAEIEEFAGANAANDDLKLQLGQLLWQFEHAERAEALFKEIIKHSGVKPVGLAARDRLAVVLLKKNNDVSGASALLTQVLDENGRDADALTTRASIAISKGDFKSAIGDYRSVLRDQPTAQAVMRDLAVAYQRDGEAEQAEDTLRAATEAGPRDLETRLAYAQLLMANRKNDQAMVVAQQLSKDFPDNLPSLELLLRIQSLQKQYEAAAATATKIQQIAPDRALGYFLAGLIEEARSKGEEARKSYEIALQKQPTTAEPLEALTRLDVRSKHVDAALARVDAAIAKYPSFMIARNLKAQLLLSVKKTDESIAVYKQIVDMDPKWPTGYLGLAVAEVSAQRADEAIQTLQHGIDMTDADTTLVSELGNLFETLGRPADAIALYDRLVSKYPNSLFVANNLAMLLVTYKEDPASIARAQKLADGLAASTLANVMDTRGWVKFKAGDFHGAESILEQAVVGAPDAPEPRFHLAMAQLRSGESQAAEQNLEAALKSDRPFNGRDVAKSTLEQLKKTPSVG